MAKIQTIKHPNGETIYPVTHVNAIIDEDGKRGTLATLADIQSAITQAITNELHADL